MRSPGSLIAPWILACGAHALLAGTVTWPLPLHLFDRIAMGHEPVATVPLFNTWTMWWNAERLGHGLDGYWNAPIFAPQANTFAFSEVQPTMLPLAPLVWMSGSPFFAANVYLLLLLTLNGLVTWLVLRKLGFGLLLAATGSVLVELLPLVHWQLGVLQMAAIFPIVATLGLWFELLERPRLTTGCGLGLAMGGTYLANHHYGLFLVILLAVSLPFLHGCRRPTRRLLPSVVVAAVTAAATVAPVAWVQWRVAHQENWQRSDEFVARLSAQPVDYLVSPNPVPNPLARLVPPERRKYWHLGVGLCQLGVGAAGAVAGLFNRRRWTGFLTAMALAAFILSLGPGWSLHGVSPYGWMSRVVPGLSLIRNAFRFAVFVQVAWVLLSIVALEQLNRVLQRIALLHDRAVLRRCLVSMVCLLLVLESWPRRGQLYDVSRFATVPPWVQWLKAQNPPDASVLCLPVPAGNSVTDYQSATIWMAWSMAHGHPLVNGYSAFFPPDYWNLQDSIRHSDGSVMRQLQQQQVRWCVVDLPANGMEIRESEDGPQPFGWIPGLTRPEHQQLSVAFCDAESKVAVFAVIGPN